MRVLFCNHCSFASVIWLMKHIYLFAFLLSPSHLTGWLHQKQPGFTIYYQSGDRKNVHDYNLMVREGMKKVKAFFSADYKTPFKVYVHPDRQSLDSTWQHNFKMPDFKSECWMVASGIADKLDMISPKQWKLQSCEHDYSNKEETQRLITHELVHVFHAQHNRSRDFSESENLDWFAEGLATYVSGQLTEEKLDEVKQAVRENQTPSSLDDFWKGKMRYQLSGSTVLFIDKAYGRKKLMELLPFTKKSEVLAALGSSEDHFLHDWKEFMLQ